MIEHKTKFKTCLQSETLQREKVQISSENGEIIGEVNLRQLEDGELRELRDRDAKFGEIVFRCIESWTFKEPSGSPLELKYENFERLTSRKKVGDQYEDGIKEILLKIAHNLNFVEKFEEKNSDGQ